MKCRNLFTILFFLIWITLSLFVGFHLPLNTIVNISYFLTIEIINMGIAYEIVLLLFVSFTNNGDPPKLGYLERRPNIALLYLSCNDAMPEALSSLNNQTYENHTIFILDDSTSHSCKTLVDSYGFKTIRRANRRGAKAGNLNNWLSLYGNQFDYFIVLDNDGILESRFIEEMIKYAEHPDNSQVAIFQSLKKAWNTRHLFPRYLDAMNQLTAIVDLHVMNKCESLITSGSNILCRTKALLEIGGFDERFATEDFATNLRLIEVGYQNRAVNVGSYFATSETAQIHTMRMTRWARGTLETAISKSWDIPLATKLRMFMAIHNYSRWLFYLFGMMLVVWGYRITWHQLYLTLFFAIRWRQPEIILYPLAILLLYTFYGILLRPWWITRLVRVSWETYWSHSLLSVALGFYALFYLVAGQIMSLSGKKAQFIIGEKRWYKTSLLEIVVGMKWTLLVSVLILIGLINNPVGHIVHFIWYIPLFFSPLVIYWAQNSKSKEDSDSTFSLPETFSEQSRAT